MRSSDEETKFHQMWRGPSIGSPPQKLRWEVVIPFSGILDLSASLAVMAAEAAIHARQRRKLGELRGFPPSRE
jgi:hypothetical protein